MSDENKYLKRTKDSVESQKKRRKQSRSGERFRLDIYFDFYLIKIYILSRSKGNLMDGSKSRTYQTVLRPFIERDVSKLFSASGVKLWEKHND